MPSWTELTHFLAHGSPERALRRDAALEHLHRASTRLAHWPELAVFAFDHRVQLEELAGAVPDAAARIARFKALLAAGARRGAELAHRAGGAAAFGAILDDRYGEDTLPTLTGNGWWIARPVELPGSRPLAFEAGPELALALRAWPTEHVAKCLVSYHPDDPAGLREAQLRQLQALQLACVGTDRELLVEVIPPREAADAPDTLARALDQIYAAGVRPDWWKLPPPDSALEWTLIDAAIERNDPHCRGVLLLGLEASEEALAASFATAAPHARCKGFAVGRSIFGEAASAWFAGSLGDDAVIADVAARYARLSELWRRARGAAMNPGDAPRPLALKDTP
jgi:5-dehydro-2-deoxygluconokinase